MAEILMQQRCQLSTVLISLAGAGVSKVNIQNSGALTCENGVMRFHSDPTTISLNPIEEKLRLMEQARSERNFLDNARRRTTHKFA